MFGQRLLECLCEREAGIDIRQPKNRVAKDLFGQPLAVVVAGERVGNCGVAVHDKRARQQVMQQHLDGWPLPLLRLAPRRRNVRP